MRDNFRDRRIPVDMIIIHSMGEFINGKFAYEFLDSLDLSAHLLILPRGDVIHGVDHHRVAFHAGKSKWKDQENLNENSIGIELLIKGDYSNWYDFVEAIKDPESFTEEHYEMCAKACRDIMRVYPKVTKDRILRHSEVSGRDVRPDPKVDPGDAFEMDKLKDMI